MEFRIPEKQVFKIGEVCEMLGLEPTVLRYWETEFDDLKPQKNPMGQRIYGPDDIQVAYLIKRLLYEEGYTIVGARKRLKRQLKEGKGAPLEREEVAEGLRGLRFELAQILAMLKGEGRKGPA
jgi:DNA-binding transcriptional MerR regulator